MHFIFYLFAKVQLLNLAIVDLQVVIISSVRED